MEIIKERKSFKLLCITLICSILIQLIIPLVSTAASLTVTLDSNATELKAGSTVEVSIYIKGDKVSYFSGYLEYDTEVFEEISKSSIYINSELTADDEYGLWTKTYSGSKISVSESNGTAYEIPNDGLLATLKFKVKTDTDTTNINITDVALVDEEHTDIDIGTVQIDLPKAQEKYTITYNPNTTDTVNNMPDNGTKTKETAYEIQGTPTRTGYTFAGWNTNANGNGTDYETGSLYTTEEDITLYAKWTPNSSTLKVDPNGGTWDGHKVEQSFKEKYTTTKTINNPTAGPSYTIGLNGNGGTIATTSTGTTTAIVTSKFTEWTKNITNGTLVGTQYTFGPAQDATDTLVANYAILDDDALVLPNVTKLGYVLSGWYTEPSGGTFVGNVGDKYKPTESKTIYAVWQEEDKYNIIYNLDGGTATGNNPSTYGASTSTFTLSNPTKTGYTFAGWTGTDLTTATKTVTINQGSTGNRIYTANWTPITYFVSYNKNGGKGTDMTNSEHTYDIDKNLTTNTYTKDGYTFKGWAKSPTSTSIDYADKQSVLNLTQTNGQTITLYAVWGVETYTVTFYDEDKTTVLKTEEVEYGKGATAPTNPSKPSTAQYTYNFAGWDKTFNNITGNLDIYATYTKTVNKYTVTFYDEDKTTVLKTEEVEYGKGATAPANPSKASTAQYTYTFAGWDKAYNNITGNLDVYATYTQETKKYTVTFYDEDKTTVLKTEEVEYGKGATAPTDPTKESTAEYTYTFAGWDKTYGNITENLNVYATYTQTTNKYTITFDPGAEGTVEEKTKEVTYGEEYGTLPTPTRPGFDFDGWYDENGNLVEETDIVYIDKDITLTAGWLGAEFTVTFDPGDGSVDTESKTVRNEGKYGELPVAEKEGYTFVGWYDENGNKIESTTIVNLEEDQTVYAKYEINKYEVTFKNNDGSIIKKIMVEHGNNARYTGETPVQNNIPAGYESTFIGWENEEALENITEEISVKATYELTLKTYTITYENLKDNDNSQNPTTYTVEDENMELVNLPNQEKLIFKGWYNSKGEKVTSIDTSKAENITLYAQWELDELYFKSQKYKVGENDIDIYEVGDIYLDKIEPNTTVAKLKENCETNGIITVIDKDGKELEEDELVGTDMTIKVTRYDEEIILKAIVMGDLDGNGLVTATDLSAINNAILKQIELEEPAFKAADLDDNEKLTATDLSTINNAILGTIELTYDKNANLTTSLTMLKNK